MLGAHLEYIAPYHWRLTGSHVVEIKRVEVMQADLSIRCYWRVESADCGPPGNWSAAGEALAHAFSLAVKDVFDTALPRHVKGEEFSRRFYDALETSGPP